MVQWSSRSIAKLTRAVAVAVAWMMAFAVGPALSDGKSGGPSLGASAGGDAARTLCVHGVRPGESLNVRARPGPDKAVVAQLTAGACGLRLVGACEGDWCDMAVGATRGWIDTRFVGIYELPAGSAPGAAGAAAERPDVPSPASVAAESRGASPTHRDATRAAAAPRRSARVVTRGPDRKPARGEETTSRGTVARTSACVARVAWWDTLRVRAGPGVGHSEIGELPPWACRVARAGACQGAWCRVAWRGQLGWVNTYYLE